MAKIVRLTEDDLTRLVKKVLNEDNDDNFRALNRLRADFQQYIITNSRISGNMQDLFYNIKEGRTNQIGIHKEELVKLLKKNEEKINELQRHISKL